MRRDKIERVANAIKFLIPLYGSELELRDADSITGWTEKGLRNVKWPKDFGKNERKLIRAIARKALKTA